MTKKKKTKETLKGFLAVFASQVVNYAVLCINYRAVAHGNYLHIAISDFAAASVTYFIIRKIAKSEESIVLWLAYALGGVVGSILGVWLSATYLN